MFMEYVQGINTKKDLLTVSKSVSFFFILSSVRITVSPKAG